MPRPEIMHVTFARSLSGAPALSLATELEVGAAQVVALDLGRVPDIDASGVAALVRVYAGLTARGARLEIVRASAAVRAALRRLGLARLLALAPQRQPQVVPAVG